MTYEIFHETKFDYASLVTFSHNIAKLKPKDYIRQKLISHKIRIDPKPYEVSDFVDYFENSNTFMLIRESHTSLTVTATSKVQRDEVEIGKYINDLRNCPITVKETRELLSSSNVEHVMAKQYLFETESIPSPSKEIQNYALESFDENRTLYEATNEFMGRIFKEFKFVPEFSDITTPIEEIFREKKGVCQDFAQFAISSLRSIGIPTKYVSGYIQTYPKEGQEKLFGVDASHAWFSIYMPGFGWADFDPTNNKIPNEEYIILGYGRDYLDISPLKGVVQSSGDSELKVRVNVKRLEK
jgi:transglutaminase-like putative cysteine protease